MNKSKETQEKLVVSRITSDFVVNSRSLCLIYGNITEYSVVRENTENYKRMNFRPIGFAGIRTKEKLNSI